MLVVTEGSWQYTYTIEDETIHYRWRILRMRATPPTESSSTLVSTSPESDSMLAEGIALTKDAAEHRAVQELTRIVAEARGSI